MPPPDIKKETVKNIPARKLKRLLFEDSKHLVLKNITAAYFFLEVWIQIMEYITFAMIFFNQNLEN